jgi:hypothetical protein
VELRYETIVVEDGTLHIYRDVYDQDTNTEENLRSVLLANGVRFEDLGEEERGEIMDALLAMSRHPKKTAVKTTPSPSPSTSPSASAKTTPVGEKVAARSPRKPIGKNQKEVVIDLAALKGKGYPSAVNLDTGSGKPATEVKPKQTVEPK